MTDVPHGYVLVPTDHYESLVVSDRVLNQIRGLLCLPSRSITEGCLEPVLDVELPEFVAKTLREHNTLRGEISDLRGQLIEIKASRLLSRGAKP